MGGCPVALPPLLVQRQIVERVGQSRAEIAKLKADAAKAEVERRSWGRSRCTRRNRLARAWPPAASFPCGCNLVPRPLADDLTLEPGGGGVRLATGARYRRSWAWEFTRGENVARGAAGSGDVGGSETRGRMLLTYRTRVRLVPRKAAERRCRHSPQGAVVTQRRGKWRQAAAA